MDYYPQPRPVLYGTSAPETPAQTQTAPVRTGPPRYPPAPPLAGDAPDSEDAPDPFDRTSTGIPVAYAGLRYGRDIRPPVLLYIFASAYSLMQFALGTMGFTDPVEGNVLLTIEKVVSVIVLSLLVWSDRQNYLLAAGLVALHISLGIGFEQWQSPDLWVAVAVLLILLKPSMWKRQVGMARAGSRGAAYSYTSEDLRRAHEARYTTRPKPPDWRMPWV